MSKNLHRGISSSNYRKSKKKNSERSKREKKYIFYRGTKVRIASYLFSDTMQARKEQREIFKVLREKREKKKKTFRNGQNPKNLHYTTYYTVFYFVKIHQAICRT